VLHLSQRLSHNARISADDWFHGLPLRAKDKISVFGGQLQGYVFQAVRPSVSELQQREKDNSTFVKSNKNIYHHQPEQ